jgi:hypothetical protein
VRAYLAPVVIGFGILFLAPASIEAAEFSDIDALHPNKDAITYLTEKGAVKGFDDGTFRSDRTVNRAEATKIIAAMLIDQKTIDGCIKNEGLPEYNDVSKGDWFAPYICAAAKEGIVIPDKSKNFRPADWITVGEMAAILARSFELEEAGPNDPWFAPSIWALDREKAIPGNIKAAAERVTRGDLAEMVWRLSAKVTDRPIANARDVILAECEWSEDEVIAGVDMQEVTRTWLSWVNDVRSDMGLHLYRPNKQLTHTARVWSVAARDLGSITHKRPMQSAYYDYRLMTDWFESFDLEFDNDAGSTFTENIGWGMYRCTSEDCTQKMISSIRTTFDFFMSEKGKEYRPHYNSIVNGDFTLAGLGIAVDSSSGKYYLTAHYSTDIISDPAPICP